ncbi:hypothetical protein B0H14DRAFT_2559770 [Mycena olivaceomarginata]|nr:hypothetical protein B0H14DRAFT_2559770 [Mycena olivaceomarginata]
MADKVFDRCTFIIRQFQPRDTPQVHALMLEGLVYGSFWILFGPDNVHRLGGAALCVPSAAPFFYSRWSITNFFLEVCAIALKADLADITAAYKLSLQLSAKVKSAWLPQHQLVPGIRGKIGEYLEHTGSVHERLHHE